MNKFQILSLNFTEICRNIILVTNFYKSLYLRYWWLETDYD